jgi:hypothetical protein
MTLLIMSLCRQAYGMTPVGETSLSAMLAFLPFG